MKENSVSYIAGFFGYFVEPISKIQIFTRSDEQLKTIEDFNKLIAAAKKEKEQYAESDERAKYLELRIELLNSVHNSLMNPESLDFSKFNSVAGTAQFALTQVFLQGTALFTTALSGGALYKELQSQVDGDISIANIDKILQTPLVNNILKDELFWQTVSLHTDDIKKIVDANEQLITDSLRDALSIKPKSELESKPEIEAATIDSLKILQVALENPIALNNIANIAEAVIPNVQKIIKEFHFKDSIQKKLEVDIDVVIGMVQKVTPTLRENNTFQKFHDENRSFLTKLVYAQNGKNEEPTLAEMSKFIESSVKVVHDLSAVSQAEMHPVIMSLIKNSTTPETIKTLEYLNIIKDGEITEFGEETLKMLEGVFASIIEESKNNKNAPKDIAEFVSKIMFLELDITDEYAINTLDFIFDALKKPANKEKFFNITKKYENETKNLINYFIVNDRNLKKETNKVYSLLKDEASFTKFNEIYEAYKKGENGKLFKAFLSNGDFRAIVIKFVIESIKYFLREGLYPNSFRRLLLNNFLDEQLTKASKEYDKDKGLVDFAESLNSEKHRGIKGFSAYYQSFKGVYIKQPFENLKIDGFNFSKTLYKGNTLTINNCKITRTNFDKIKGVKKVVIKDSVMDLKTLASLTERIEKKNINFEYGNLTIITNQNDLEILKSEGKINKLLEKLITENSKMTITPDKPSRS